jgi:hypothetical protein
MDKILAQRYAFCDFSKIVGFPNPVPSRDEWEGCIPRFRGEDWEVPAEHLLDFHDFIYHLQIMHEDVHINIFRYSLEGKAREWCRSLSAACIQSLKYFHIAFNNYCKQGYGDDLLYEGCCMEFNKLYRRSANQSVCNQGIVEEIIPQDFQHVSHDFQNDIFSQETKVEIFHYSEQCGEVVNLVESPFENRNHEQIIDP